MLMWHPKELYGTNLQRLQTQHLGENSMTIRPMVLGVLAKIDLQAFQRLAVMEKCFRKFPRGHL
jgi:hypothetical protein